MKETEHIKTLLRKGIFMNYLKNYIITHLKFWWLYIVAIFSSLFGMFFVVIFVGRLLDSMSIKSSVNLVLSSLIAAFIGGLPIVYTNFCAAKNNENRGIVIKTIINHFITIIVFYAIIHFCLYCLIIDFRM